MWENSEEDELNSRRVEDLDDYSSIDDVLGRQMEVQVIVHSVSEIPEKFSRHPQVRRRTRRGRASEKPIRFHSPILRPAPPMRSPSSGGLPLGGRND